MRGLVRRAMEEGALGVASSLIDPPGFFAKTDELIELAKVAADYNGIYISRLRNEGRKFLEALDELIEIARAANIRAEVYHLTTRSQRSRQPAPRVRGLPPMHTPIRPGPPDSTPLSHHRRRRAVSMPRSLA